MSRTKTEEPISMPFVVVRAQKLCIRWRPGGVCANVKFYTKRAALVLFCAVLTAHLCSYNIKQCDASLRTPLRELTALPQASWLDFGEWKGRGKLDRKRRDRKG